MNGSKRARNTLMGTNSQLSQALRPRPGERRRNPRFDMHFTVFLRRMGEPWVVTETTDVSAAGASFSTDRPFLLNTPVEYVLTFPPDLTKAQQPLRMRFYASVLRCERIPSGDNPAFSVAVRNTTHRYLSPEESATFDALERRAPGGSLSNDSASRT